MRYLERHRASVYERRTVEELEALLEEMLIRMHERNGTLERYEYNTLEETK